MNYPMLLELSRNIGIQQWRSQELILGGALGSKYAKKSFCNQPDQVKSVSIQYKAPLAWGVRIPPHTPPPLATLLVFSTVITIIEVSVVCIVKIAKYHNLILKHCFFVFLISSITSCRSSTASLSASTTPTKTIFSENSRSPNCRHTSFFTSSG